jgi:hypothetical protein
MTQLNKDLILQTKGYTEQELKTLNSTAISMAEAYRELKQQIALKADYVQHLDASFKQLPEIVRPTCEGCPWTSYDGDDAMICTNPASPYHGQSTMTLGRQIEMFSTQPCRY